MRKIHITKFLSFKVVLLAVYLLGVSDVGLFCQISNPSYVIGFLVSR